jgi:hypothetical protein
MKSYSISSSLSMVDSFTFDRQSEKEKAKNPQLKHQKNKVFL